MAVKPRPKKQEAGDGATTESPAPEVVTGDGQPPGQPQVSRRQFLTLGGAAAAGLVVGGAVGYALHQPPAAVTAEAPPPPLKFFNAAQLTVVEAMAETIFPTTSDGPGAKQARVAYYIDGQLASGWGRGERLYKQGPFLTPQDTGHGWQIPMTPRDVYADALTAIATYTKKQFNKTFDLLTPEQQTQTLQLMSDGKMDTFTTVTSAQFFSMFRQNTLEGLFGDPLYGGNYNLIGWRWVGFPGNPHAYGNVYGKHIFNFQPYKVEPKPLA